MLRVGRYSDYPVLPGLERLSRIIVAPARASRFSTLLTGLGRCVSAFHAAAALGI